MLELLINRKLRKNYNDILKLDNEESIKKFLSGLSEKERNELYTYSYGYAIRDRIKEGFPISEYFLLHCEDFIPDTEKQMFERADRHLNYIFLFAALIYFYLFYF